MKATKLVICLATAATTLMFAPFASAQDDERFTLGKPEYQPGETINLVYDPFTLTCKGNASSPGFVGRVASDWQPGSPGTLRATATAVDLPGIYTATLVCDGARLSRKFVIVGTADAFFLDKTEVEAGGAISVLKTKQSNCGQVATSAGFTAPVELVHQSANLIIGNGTAVDRAGRYEVEMVCGGQPVLQQFVVTAKAPAAPVLKPKSPIVKPNGAPQTGGGGTA